MVFRAAFLIAVTVSGFCSLVYQVVWDRLARYNFGGDNTSASIVIAVFLLGLGLGAYFFSRVRRRHLTVYGLVEIGIGLFALVSFSVIGSLSQTLVEVFRPGMGDVGGIRILTIVGCALFFLPPCILMGGTLPLMFAGFFARQRLSGQALGMVYGLNILGAVTGTFAVPYLLLNNLAIPDALAVAASLNVAIGIVAILLDYWVPTAPDIEDAVAEIAPSDLAIPASLWLTFLTGFFTAMVEVVFIRQAFDLLPGAPYNFAFVIGTVLFALSLGSILLPGRAWVLRNPPVAVAGMLGAAAAFLVVSCILAQAMVSSRILVPDLERLGATWAYYMVLCFPTFFFLGGIFPLLCSAVRTENIARHTGRMYILNSLGAFLGAALFHFVGSETIGARNSLVLLVLVTLATAAWLASTADRQRLPVWYGMAAGVLLAFILLPLEHLLYGPSVARAPTAFIQEGSSGIAAVTWESNGTGEAYVNGQGMGQLPTEPKHYLQLGVALSAHPEPKRALVLGLGSGTYVRALLSLPSIESVVVVDWSKELPRLLAREDVTQRIGDTVSDHRVTVVTGDARLAAAVLPINSFDLVLDNLVYPTWVGATGVRTPYFFSKIANLLTDDGVYGITTNYARWRSDILAGLLASFDHVYENEVGHMVVAADIDVSRPGFAVISTIASEMAEKSGMTAASYQEMLRSGLMSLKATDIAAAPFQEDRVFSEYYYTFDEFLTFLPRF
ncbi:hypothetical protein [Devosia sp.]|uniref:spermine/spermidine synthase domain-containing protein n=1 Tax=Devosia sp. TaxID=1871048 RepID=UPI001B2D7172|nr:hypothetical protein [Devosia sp.]MBO9589522.1 hypothetical protein [Devosia sp.]